VGYGIYKIQCIFLLASYTKIDLRGLFGKSRDRSAITSHYAWMAGWFKLNSRALM
jgi:hypothetical protein